MVFRSSPQLGPELEVAYTGPQSWDGLSVTAPSYQLGNTEKGSDGHDYTWVQAAGTLAAGADIGITEATWLTTTGTTHEVPPGLTGGVVAGQCFHARKLAL